MTHGNSSVGDLRAALASGDSAAMEFDCAGEEGTLGACQWRNRSAMGVQTDIHSTGSSKKNPAKFGDTSSVRADGQCIGCLGQLAERGRENSKHAGIFSQDPLSHSFKRKTFLF